METQYSNFFIIVAPGFSSYGQNGAESLKRAFEPVSRKRQGKFDIIGDGVNDINIRSIETIFRKFTMGLTGPVCIIFRGHGKIESSKLFLVSASSFVAFRSILMRFVYYCSPLNW